MLALAMKCLGIWKYLQYLYEENWWALSESQIKAAISPWLWVDSELWTLADTVASSFTPGKQTRPNDAHTLFKKEKLNSCVLSRMAQVPSIANAGCPQDSRNFTCWWRSLCWEFLVLLGHAENLPLHSTLHSSASCSFTHSWQKWKQPGWLSR